MIPSNSPAVHMHGKLQKMTTDGGEVKGLQQTLEQHGFDVNRLKVKCVPRCPHESEQCCMACLLSQQDDFVNQTSMLEQLIVNQGHLCIFLPKFHCNLNPIEMVCEHILKFKPTISQPSSKYWGWAKYRYRQAIKPTFDLAKKAAMDALDNCPLETICCFINQSWRFHSAYRLGLTGKAAEWAIKKQCSHRSISEQAWIAIEALISRSFCSLYSPASKWIHITLL